MLFSSFSKSPNPYILVKARHTQTNWHCVYTLHVWSNFHLTQAFSYDLYPFSQCISVFNKSTLFLMKLHAHEMPGIKPKYVLWTAWNREMYWNVTKLALKNCYDEVADRIWSWVLCKGQLTVCPAMGIWLYPFLYKVHSTFIETPWNARWQHNVRRPQNSILFRQCTSTFPPGHTHHSHSLVLARSIIKLEPNFF